MPGVRYVSDPTQEEGGRLGATLVSGLHGLANKAAETGSPVLPLRRDPEHGGGIGIQSPSSEKNSPGTGGYEP